MRFSVVTVPSAKADPTKTAHDCARSFRHGAAFRAAVGGGAEIIIACTAQSGVALTQYQGAVTAEPDNSSTDCKKRQYGEWYCECPGGNAEEVAFDVDGGGGWDDSVCPSVLDAYTMRRMGDPVESRGERWVRTYSANRRWIVQIKVGRMNAIEAETRATGDKAVGDPAGIMLIDPSATTDDILFPVAAHMTGEGGDEK